MTWLNHTILTIVLGGTTLGCAPRLEPVRATQSQVNTVIADLKHVCSNLTRVEFTLYRDRDDKPAERVGPIVIKDGKTLKEIADAIQDIHSSVPNNAAHGMRLEWEEAKIDLVSESGPFKEIDGRVFADRIVWLPSTEVAQLHVGEQLWKLLNDLADERMTDDTHVLIHPH